MKRSETFENLPQGYMHNEKKNRESNIELMRIIMMLLIIAHHYVVNSGITNLYNFSNITVNMIFLQVIGLFGKTIINCFILITGYFSIKGKFSFKKVIRLFLEIKFYTLITYFILTAIGIGTFSIKGLIKTVFYISYGVNNGFAATFFLLYLLIPFVNILINQLNKKQYIILLSILLFYFTIISTFSYSNNTFNEITWYIVVYMIGAFLKTYPIKYNNTKILWIVASIVCIILSIISIIGIDIINYKFYTHFDPYYFLASHKLLAVLMAISLFMLFKNIKIRYSKTINMIASTTFGVLLIHANSDIMRKLIWQDIFNVKGQYYSKDLCVHTILTVLIVYVICVCIDLVRIKLIEKPLFSFLESKNNFNKLCDKVDTSINL